MKHLTKRGEALYGFAAFGPNLMMIMFSAYVINAFILPAGFDWEQRMVWTFSGVAIVHTVLFGVTSALARIFDAIVDFPLSVALQNMHSKFGRHRTGLVIGMIPMIIGFIALLFPILTPAVAGQSLSSGAAIGQTFYLMVILFVFFTGYTMTLITYYSTYAEITENEASRVRLGSWKSVWDTVGFSIGYALIPLIVGWLSGPAFAIGMSPVIFTSLLFSPTFLTMLIPLFMAKGDRGSNTKKIFAFKADTESTAEPPLEMALGAEDSTTQTATLQTEQVLSNEPALAAANVLAIGSDGTAVAKKPSKWALLKTPAIALNDAPKEPIKKETLVNSLKVAFVSKEYRAFLYVLMAMQFGLQLYLATQHIYAIGVLGMNGWQIAVMNACAFGFVPLTIVAFNKIQKKKGIRFAFRLCLLSFMICVGIFSMSILTRNSGWLPNMLLGILASLFASYPIAVFFAVTYIIPSQIGVMHMQKTGRNATSTFFAAQGLVVTVVSALSVNLVWIIGLSGVTIMGNTYGYNMYSGMFGLTENYRYFWAVCSETGYGLLYNGLPVLQRSQYAMQRTGEYMYVARDFMSQFTNVSEGAELVRVHAYRFRYVFHGYIPQGEQYYYYNGVLSSALYEYLNGLTIPVAGGEYISRYARIEGNMILVREGFIQERGLFGTLFIMPITAVSMLVAFFLAAKLPKRYETNDGPKAEAESPNAETNVENNNEQAQEVAATSEAVVE